jgi:MoxR-like ATPase
MFSVNLNTKEQSVRNERSSDIEQKVNNAVAELGKALLGKELQIRLALCCMFSGGHLLIEDLPGMGKTTLSHALARAFGLAFNRIQFTSDLLPADILGVSIFDQAAGSFNFHPGPIFSQLILADEINRTTPKTQSALLEAMEEGQVTVEGETRALPEPFFVVATQNPVTLSGTYPLPESQLDRFLMRLQLGYPDHQAERKILAQDARVNNSEAVSKCLSAEDVKEFRDLSMHVHASESLLDYVQRIIAHTRKQEDFHFGLSPRGSLALMRAARTWALMAGRQHVIPEDVQAVLPPVVEHRLRAVTDEGGYTGASLAQRLLNEVDVLE